MDLKWTTQNTAEDMAYVKGILKANVEEEERTTIRRWLYPDETTAESSVTAALEMKQSETGRWLLDSGYFNAWKDSVHKCIWVYGIGKKPFNGFWIYY
jgi:hypothetical protein